MKKEEEELIDCGEFTDKEYPHQHFHRFWGWEYKPKEKCKLCCYWWWLFPCDFGD